MDVDTSGATLRECVEKLTTLVRIGELADGVKNLIRKKSALNPSPFKMTYGYT